MPAMALFEKMYRPKPAQNLTVGGDAFTSLAESPIYAAVFMDTFAFGSPRPTVFLGDVLPLKSAPFLNASDEDDLEDEDEFDEDDFEDDDYDEDEDDDDDEEDDYDEEDLDNLEEFDSEDEDLDEEDDIEFEDFDDEDFDDFEDEDDDF